MYINISPAFSIRAKAGAVPMGYFFKPPRFYKPLLLTERSDRKANDLETKWTRWIVGLR